MSLFYVDPLQSSQDMQDKSHFNLWQQACFSLLSSASLLTSPEAMRGLAPQVKASEGASSVPSFYGFPLLEQNLPVFDQSPSLNKLCNFISQVACKEKPVSWLHFVGKSHESQGVTTQCCKNIIDISGLFYLHFVEKLFSHQQNVTIHRMLLTGIWVFQLCYKFMHFSALDPWSGQVLVLLYKKLQGWSHPQKTFILLWYNWNSLRLWLKLSQLEIKRSPVNTNETWQQITW